MNPVTFRELSNLLSGLVAERTLREWAKSGVLSSPAKGARGKGDAWEWVRQILAHYQGKSSEQTDALRDAKIRAENARAKKAEIWIGEASGELVRAEQVVATWSAAFSVCKSKLLGMAGALVDELQGITDPVIRKEIIEAAVYEALEELGRGQLVRECNSAIGSGGDGDFAAAEIDGE